MRPASRASCALAAHRGSAAPVCFGDRAGVHHHARCPAARRLARQRVRWAWLQTAVLWCAIGSVGAAALLSVWVRTCGLGAPC